MGPGPVAKKLLLAWIFSPLKFEFSRVGVKNPASQKSGRICFVECKVQFLWNVAFSL